MNRTVHAEALRQDIAIGVMLPAQVYTAQLLAPEQHLLCAVLVDAIACVRRYRNAHRGEAQRLYRDAARWIRGEDGDPPLRFEFVCGVLALDPAGVREALGLADRRPPRPAGG